MTLHSAPELIRAVLTGVVLASALESSAAAPNERAFDGTGKAIEAETTHVLDGLVTDSGSGFAAGPIPETIGEDEAILIGLARRPALRAAYESVKAAGTRRSPEPATSRAAGLMADYVTEVRIGFLRVVATAGRARLARSRAKAGRAALKVMKELVEQGSAPTGDYQRMRRRASTLELERIEAEGEAVAAREHLNALMGLAPEEASVWAPQGRLGWPRPEADAHFAGDLGAQALRASFELAARRAEIAELKSILAKESVDGAAAQSLRAPLATMCAEYDAEAQRIQATARWLEQAMHLAEASAHEMRHVYLPAAAAILDATERDYNAMQVGVFALLQAKLDQLRAGIERTHVLERFWRLKALRDQVRGGGTAPVIDGGRALASANHNDDTGGH